VGSSAPYRRPFVTESNDGTRFRLGHHVHTLLQEFCWLAEELLSHPTSMLTVVPSTNPGTRGTCDALKMRIGGVHFISQIDCTITHRLCCAPYPPKVTRQLGATDNPGGRINNIDLELAGSVGHHNILCQLATIVDITFHNCYENTATMFWQRK
jgi:hypothetical protein